MNSQSIATYIANLEKENAELKERLRKCEEEKSILEYETMLHYAEVSDNESVASDSEYETETESESESESDDYFVCYNLPLTHAFDDLAQEEENGFNKSVYERAANIIYHLDFKLRNGKQIAHLPGIGKGVIRKINEFLETGEIKSVKRFATNENIAEQLDLLARVEKDTHKSEAYKTREAKSQKTWKYKPNEKTTFSMRWLRKLVSDSSSECDVIKMSLSQLMEHYNSFVTEVGAPQHLLYTDNERGISGKSTRSFGWFMRDLIKVQKVPFTKTRIQKGGKDIVGYTYVARDIGNVVRG